MPRKATFTFISIFLFAITPLFSQSVEWVVQEGEAGEEVSLAIDIDALGNSFVTGYIDASSSFGTEKIACIDHDVFIAKYNSSAELEWSTRMGGRNEDAGYSIKTDHLGNVFVMGIFADTLFKDSLQLISKGGHDVFLAKFDQNGNLQWLKQAGGSGYDYGYGLNIDNKGNVFITGSFSGKSFFNSSSMNSFGFNDIFIAKYDSNGNVAWVRSAGSLNGYDEGFSIAIDSIDNVYVSGVCYDQAQFSSITLTTNGNGDAFLAKYNSIGNIEWVRNFGGTKFDGAFGLNVSNEGKITMTGSFYDTLIYNSETIISSGHADIFISQFDTSGNLIWIKKAGGAGFDHGWNVATDKNGNCYLTGLISDQVQFSDKNITTKGLQDAFLAKYDAQGTVDWVFSVGGKQNDVGYGVKTDNNNNIYFTGTFRDTAIFGSITKYSNGNNDFFSLKVDPTLIGIKESELNNINFLAYPNPTKNQINITYLPTDNNRPLAIRIINVLGEVVYNNSDLFITERSSLTIDLSDKKSGIYLIELSAEGKKNSKKISLIK